MVTIELIEQPSIAELEARLKKAEAEAGRLRAALEMIISRAWGCVPLVAREVQQIAEAALHAEQDGNDNAA